MQEMQETVSLIPESGRPLGRGNDNLLHYSCLANPMDRGAWLATDHGIAKSQTRLSAHIQHHAFYWKTAFDSIFIHFYVYMEPTF